MRRKPKSTSLKLLHGNPAGRKLPKRVLGLKTGIPKPPQWIQPRSSARNVWNTFAKELDAMGVLTVADRAALAALVSAYVDWREASDALLEHGLTYERISDRGGSSIVARPEVAIRNDAWKRYKSMLLEFGLTPSARTRVSVNPRQEKSALQKLIDRE